MENKDSIEKQYSGSKKASVVWGLITILILVAIIVVILQFDDFGDAMIAIKNASGASLLIAGAFLLAYILIYPLGFCVLAKRKKINASFADNYFIGASEHFFNGITPYQTGAQPFQIYRYTKLKVKASDATGITLVNFLSLLIASNVFVAVSLIFGGDFFSSFKESNTLFIPIIGITMNFFTLVFFVCVAFCKWVRDGLIGLIKLIGKIRFLNKPINKILPMFEQYCENAQMACKEAIYDIKGFIPVVLLKIVSLFCYYSIPYFILRALNASVDMTFFQSMLATAFIVNSVVWFPTPGTSGGIEFAFVVVLSLTNSMAVASGVIWRGLTYYVLMIVSAVEYFSYLIVKKIRKNILEDKEIEENVGSDEYHHLPSRIDVLMAGDENVIEGIKLSMLSAVMRTDAPIHFHLMTTFAVGTKGITKETVFEIEKALKTINEETKITYIDATNDYDEWFTSSPNKKPAYSPCSLLRLFASKYINSDRLVYLDVDTMCAKSLTEFFKYDISDYEIAVTKDYMGRFWIRRDYFNSGVLFINMAKTKETKMFERTVELLSKKKFFMADQSALYKTSKQRLYLPTRFNEQRNVKDKTVIKHFNKGIRYLPFFHIYNIKQWQRDKVHKNLRIFEFDDVYDAYDRIFGGETI